MPAGRPPFINDEERKDMIINALKMGVSQKTACGYARVAESTYYKCINIADEHTHNGIESEYTDFSKRIHEAKSSFQLSIVAKIQNYISEHPDDVDTLFKLLARRAPEDWGDKQQVDINQQSLSLNVNLNKEEQKRIEQEIDFIEQKSITEKELFQIEHEKEKEH